MPMCALKGSLELFLLSILSLEEMWHKSALVCAKIPSKSRIKDFKVQLKVA